MENFDSLPKIFNLGFYCPLYNYEGDDRYFNEDFNKYSHKILDLKNSNYEAIKFFTKELERIIDNEPVVIAAVPSSNANCLSSGIVYLSQQLVQSKQNLIDGTTCIKRIKSIAKQSHSSEKRNKERHKDSIEIKNKSLIKDQKVILLDDVLTTGTTVETCQELLLEAGAKEVKIIVLGKTIRDVDYYYDWLEEYYLNLIINKVEKEVNKERDRQWKELSDTYKIKHRKIDEWAENERQELKYFNLDDDYGHYCIDQEAEEEHNGLHYEEKNGAAYIDKEAEKIKDGAAEIYMRSKDEIYDAIKGNSCLSPSNPFLKLFLN
ncbi:MAG: ComF family protein [Crocosphaera sp.]